MEFNYELIIGGKLVGCFKTKESGEAYAKAKGLKDYVVYKKRS